MPSSFRLPGALLGPLVALCAVPLAAPDAQALPVPVDRGPAPVVLLDGVEAERRVKDAVLPPGAAHAASAAPLTRVERFTDPQGRTVEVATAIEGVDLAPIAGILASTIHGDELARLKVRVVAMADVSDECGGGEGVVACYRPGAGRGELSGEMTVAHDDSDLAHTVVHEYGHHMDFQLLNLAHLDICDRSSDGSRGWFFTRDAEDDLAEATSCDDDTRWDLLLPEVFAEDFVRLNGIDDWQLPEIPAPSRRTLDALAADIAAPFAPSSRAFRGRLRRHQAVRRRLHLETWAFLVASSSGRSAAGLDVAVFRHRGHKALERSRRRGSRDSITLVLPPGRYDVELRATRGGGAYRLELGVR